MFYFTLSKDGPTKRKEIKQDKLSVSTRVTPKVTQAKKKVIKFNDFEYLVEFLEEHNDDFGNTIPSMIRITGKQYFPYGNYAYNEASNEIISLDESMLMSSVDQNSNTHEPAAHDFYISAHDQAMIMLKSVMTSLDTSELIGVTTFGNDGLWNLKLKRYIAQIDYGQEVKLDESSFKQAEFGNLIDSSTSSYVIKLFNDALTQAMSSNDNAQLKELLARGSAGTLPDNSAEKVLYDNLTKIAEVTESNKTFKESAAKAAEQIDISKPLENHPLRDPFSPIKFDSVDLPKDTPLAKDDEKQLSQTAAPDDSQQADDSEQQPPQEAPQQAQPDTSKADTQPKEAQPKKVANTTLFRYNLYGADPSKDADLTIAFNDGKTLQYKIPANRINSFNSFLLNDDNRQEFEQRKGTTITVTITATPQSGGEVTSDSHDIEIPDSLTNTQAYSFRFSPERGWSSSNGQEVGPTGAIDKQADAAQVFEVFYTKNGGAGTALVDVNVDAIGKKYVFSFRAEPLLVPIEIEENAAHKKPLNEGVVPHWIFIKSQSGNGKADTNGNNASSTSDASSASDAGTHNLKGINIAVRKITISTLKKWIAVPNVGVPFEKETFKVELAQGNGENYANIPESARGTVYAMNDLNTINLSLEQASELVYRTLFENSVLWRKVGGDSLNCWSKDSTVTGLSLKAATLRKPSYVA